MRDVDSRRGHSVSELDARDIRPDGAHERDGGSQPRRSDGLVGALATGCRRVIGGMQRLALARKLHHAVGAVEVQ